MDNLNEGGILKFIEKAISFRSETYQVEFKDARSGAPTDLWQPVSAFSNCPGGGIIVFGIKEDRSTGTIEIVGNSDLAHLQEMVSSYLSEKMTNVGKYSLKIIEYSNSKLLVLSIGETPKERKPCYYTQLGMPKGSCIRQGNINRRLTDEEVRTFIRYSSNYRFDKSQAPGVDFEILSIPKIKEFLEKSAKRVGRTIDNSKVQIKDLKNLAIMDDFEMGVFPTMAGYLIFSSKQPQLLEPFVRYTARCARYSGNDPSSKIIDSQDVMGTLDEQIDGTLNFILRNIGKKVDIVGSKRVETYEYPEEALREIVANAIIHRDYMITGTYVQVNIFSNRIEISNPGNLPPGITVENLKIAQFSRNEVIAKILRDLDYMEEFGRGIDLVYAKMKQWSLFEPLFKNSSNSFKVTLLGELFKSLNDRQIKIWEYMQDKGSITALRAVAIFNNKVPRITINGDIRKMIALDLIVQKGSSTNTYYEPQY